MRSLRSRMCLRLASALAALANVPPVWVFWSRKGSPCSDNHAYIHTYPFPLPFNPSPIKPPSRFPLAPFGGCGRLGQSGFCPLRAQSLCLSPTGSRKYVLLDCLRIITKCAGAGCARLRAPTARECASGLVCYGSRCPTISQWQLLACALCGYGARS